MYVPESLELRNLVWKEVHTAPYFRHPRVTKLLADIKPLYFWKGMKKDVARFMAICLECQMVKGEYQHFIGLLQPMSCQNENGR